MSDAFTCDYCGQSFKRYAQIIVVRRHPQIPFLSHIEADYCTRCWEVVKSQHADKSQHEKNRAEANRRMRESMK